MAEKVGDKVVVSSKELTAYLLMKNFTLIKVFRNKDLKTNYVFLNQKGIIRAIEEYSNR